MSYYDDPTYSNGNNGGYGYGTMVPVQQNTGLSLRTSRTLSRSMEHENGRAILTTTAMQNTATLCAMGERLAEAVPSSREELGTIVKAYACASARRIMEW